MRVVLGSLLLLLLACTGSEDLGFEVVRVPASAYGQDAAALDGGDGGADATSPLVVCQPGADEGASEAPQDYPNCALRLENRTFDTRATARHRHDEGSDVCCYRR